MPLMSVNHTLQLLLSRFSIFLHIQLGMCQQVFINKLSVLNILILQMIFNLEHSHSDMLAVGIVTY